jgi:hypothetical protein
MVSKGKSGRIGGHIPQLITASEAMTEGMNSSSGKTLNGKVSIELKG